MRHPRPCILATGVTFLLLPAAAELATAQQAAPSQPPETRYQPQAVLQTKPLRVQVLDGVTFKDIEDGTVYRLYGIDACAPDQSATLGRQPWPCGVMATSWLVNATLNQWLSCNVLRQGGGISYARCASSIYPDVALAMLKAGMAISVPPSPEFQPIRIYKDAEGAARKAFQGLWQSSFEMPWEYRARIQRSTLPGAEAPPENPSLRPGPPGLAGYRSLQDADRAITLALKRASGQPVASTPHRVSLASCYPFSNLRIWQADE